MKILIADDNHVERLILSKVIENLGHQVIQAEDGALAVTQFNDHQPDFVFLDVLMPQLDGYEVAEILKGENAKSWFPIVFLTSLTEASDLARCIESGGDDFVSKPINKVIIKAKIEAFERIINLYNTVDEQKEKIQYHHQHLVQEQEAAKRVFNNIAHRGCLESPNINYHLSPMSIFNGDLMLAAELPMGGMRLMLADFTGHGLPAAIGAMPTSEIFYGMTAKGFSIRDMMTEMNSRLYNVLPRGVFCCVIVFDIDSLDERLTIWNAGAPDSYLLDCNRKEIQRIHSSHLPIGIQSPEKFEVTYQSFEFTKQHKIIVITDGIIEAINSQEEMFGEKNLYREIEKNILEDNICQKLMDKVEEFCGASDPTDDLSLLEVSSPIYEVDKAIQAKVSDAKNTGVCDSRLSLTLRGRSLANFDPIPLFLQTFVTCNELIPHRAEIFTLLSELYNNALDHGVLGLSSSMKSSSDGFAQYYQKRAESLEKLTKGHVTLTVDHRPTDDGGELMLELSDSGSGFDLESLVQPDEKNYSGRGLPLLFKLCDSIEYFDQGTRVVAIYRWYRSNERKIGA